MYEEPLKWYQRVWPQIVVFALAALSLILVIPEFASGDGFDTITGLIRTLLYVGVGVTFVMLRRRGLRNNVLPARKDEAQ